MAFDENSLMEQVNSLKVQLRTCQEASGPAIQRVRDFKANFGVKERADGSIDVDYQKFVERIGMGGWLILRQIGDETHKVTGAAGEKPRVKVSAAA